MNQIAKPMVISVCAECEQSTLDAIDAAYLAGMHYALQVSRNRNAYWAKDLEALLFGETQTDVVERLPARGSTRQDAQQGPA